MPPFAAIEAVMKLINRELWLITASDGVRRGGLVATWVSAASLDRERPVMLAGLAPNHFTAELIEASGCFGLHLIGVEQWDLAWEFARRSGRDCDKLAGRECFTSVTGAPLLRDALAWLDVRVIARYDAGDRIFYWADVVAGQVQRAGAPAREQDLLASLSSEQKQTLMAGRDADIACHRPLHAAWREQWST